MTFMKKAAERPPATYLIPLLSQGIEGKSCEVLSIICFR